MYPECSIACKKDCTSSESAWSVQTECEAQRLHNGLCGVRYDLNIWSILAESPTRALVYCDVCDNNYYRHREIIVTKYMKDTWSVKIVGLNWECDSIIKHTKSMYVQSSTCYWPCLPSCRWDRGCLPDREDHEALGNLELQTHQPHPEEHEKKTVSTRRITIYDWLIEYHRGQDVQMRRSYSIVPIIRFFDDHMIINI